MEGRIARLQQLASIAERSGADASAIARLLEAAAVATMHAVALELLNAGRLRPVAAAEQSAPAETLREAA